MRRIVLKNSRQGKGYTQLELAEKIGCKERDITLLETGRSSPTYGLACRIAEALGTDVKQLFPELN
jgi:transcriptional regulator with XRE-family HTH domain